MLRDSLASLGDGAPGLLDIAQLVARSLPTNQDAVNTDTRAV